MKYISWARCSHPETATAKWNIAFHAFGNFFDINIIIRHSRSKWIFNDGALSKGRQGHVFESWISLFGFGFMIWFIL